MTYKELQEFASKMSELWGEGTEVRLREVYDEPDDYRITDALPADVDTYDDGPMLYIARHDPD